MAIPDIKVPNITVPQSLSRTPVVGGVVSRTSGAINDALTQTKQFVMGDTGRMSLDIDTYKSKFLGANARAYLFLVKIQFPGLANVLKSSLQAGIAGGTQSITNIVQNGLAQGAVSAISNIGTTGGTEDFKYYVKASSLPESSIEETNTFWQGQMYRMSGVRRFNEWTVTMLIDNDALVLRKFWEWHNLIHNPETNEYGMPSDYMADQVVMLLGMDGQGAIATYKMYGAWPKSIGQVSLEYATNDFATVDITFAYQYHTVTQTEESGMSKVMKKSVKSFLDAGGIEAVRDWMGTETLGQWSETSTGTGGLSPENINDARGVMNTGGSAESVMGANEVRTQMEPQPSLPTASNF